MSKKQILRSGLLAWGLLVSLWFSMAGAPTVVAHTRAATVPQGPLVQVVITPTKDNTLFESADNPLSSGAGGVMFVGRLGSKGDGLRRRGVVAFDLSGRIPTSATLVSVTLQLQLVKENSGAASVTLHKVSADWGEGASSSSTGNGAPAQTGDATWLHTFFNTASWAQPGGDFTATASATTIASSNGTYTWGSTPALVADVEGWLADPTSNFGWLVKGDESAQQTAKQFGTRENNTAANRPQLTIIYTTPGGNSQAVYLPLIWK